MCETCGTEFPRLAIGWDFTVARAELGTAEWDTWDELQANGVASYEAEPQNNLGVGDRADYQSFGRFCDFTGLILDIGCGPQAWPTHFGSRDAAPATFVGVDPLVGNAAADYTQVRGLAEQLPFKTGAFDQAVMATTLDHFVDPLLALREAARVCRPDGVVSIWIGEKSPDAPRPEVSPAWYRSLKQPAGAEDVFHFERLSLERVEELLDRAGLDVSRRETHSVDEFRRNVFLQASLR